MNCLEPVDPNIGQEAYLGSSIVKQTILGMAGIALVCIARSLSVRIQVVHVQSGIGAVASKIPGLPWSTEFMIKR